MLPFSRPSCYFKTRPPSCALGTSFYTVSEGRDLMTYVSDNYTSYSAPSPLSRVKHELTVDRYTTQNGGMATVEMVSVLLGYEVLLLLF